MTVNQKATPGFIFPHTKGFVVAAIFKLNCITNVITQNKIINVKFWVGIHLQNNKNKAETDIKDIKLVNPILDKS